MNPFILEQKDGAQGNHDNTASTHWCVGGFDGLRSDHLFSFRDRVLTTGFVSTMQQVPVEHFVLDAQLAVETKDGVADSRGNFDGVCRCL